MKVSPYMMRVFLNQRSRSKDEGIAQRDKKIKTQYKGIARTQCSKLHKMNLTLEKTI
jgi:hypothetical protein